MPQTNEHTTTSATRVADRANGEEHEARRGGTLRMRKWGYRHASRERFAVRGLDLTIDAGEHVLLLGASGIGKSTILEGAAGLLGDEDAATLAEHDGDEPVMDADGGVTEGVIDIDGVEVHRARGAVGLVLQDPDAQAIFQRIGDNVAFGPENLDVPRKEIWERVDASLNAVGLGGLQLDRSVMHLSGGQMQRLALAGALAMEPKVLLLDEPTANLDPDGVVQIVGAVRDVLERTGCTMVLVEHRADRWIELIDRVVVLGLERDDDGRAVNQEGYDDEIARDGFRNTVVIADGTPDEVFGDDTIDFAKLGIWVPQRYRRHGDEITRMHVDGEPGCDPASGRDDVVLGTDDLGIGRNGDAIAEHIGVSFRPGQITALVGANGAGKSTLSLTLAGLLEPLAGRVVAGSALAEGAHGAWPINWSSTELASRISYVFQNPEHQFACSSVLDEVMLGPRRTGVDEETARKRARELLGRFHLARYADVNPYTLSGGEKRRLTVAAALAAAPKVLILDEPTFGQDRRTWMQIVRLILGLRGDGVSIVVVTHDRELVTALGARVVELVVGVPAPDGATGSVATGSRTANDDAAGNDARGSRVTGGIDDAVGGAGLVTGSAVGVAPDDATGSGMEDVARNRKTTDSRVAQTETPTSTEGRPGAHAARNDGTTTSADAAMHGEQVVRVSAVNERHDRIRPASRSPYLASLNPVFRLGGAFLASLPLLLSLDWVSATVALAAEFLVLMVIGFTPWRVIRSTWPIFIGAPGSALAVLLYGKQGGDVWWQWGWIAVTDRSAQLALATALRILAIGIPAIIAVLGIDATDLADGFSELLHLPDRFVYGGLAGMRLFSVLQDDWTALTASRRSRGLGDDNKFAAFFPQAFALLVLSIRRSTTLATAMQARGFGGAAPRSHARVSEVHARDWWFLIGCAALPTIALVCAAFAGTFSFMGN
ncbi:ABC transporter ATP-binding protein [Bifidobacterium italicum]|uniref:ABC transporter ATP-binding protein n=2 Tax=Bifidobacterium italicum TaxID=1960968 RepID=A0A2A2EKM9_9BIFI|nr:ABC transporter ATP-binding protein [Bifidobacterium italicum]